MSQIFLILLAVLLVRRFLNRNAPRVGGKVGARQFILPAVPVPDGFSRVDTRLFTVFAASSETTNAQSSKAFLRHETVRQPTLMRVYRVAGFNCRIEVPVESPRYERIDVTEALALLRELPDPRLVYRLQLSDAPCFLDPWVRKVTGRQVCLLGNATNAGLVVLYAPDRRQGQNLGLTLLHEWLHLVAFKSAGHVRRFKRANAIEQLAPVAIEPVSFGDRKTAVYEAWADLGEKLFGYDDAIAHEAALAAPLHAMILWRCIGTILRSAPARPRSLHESRRSPQGAVS